jgi:hypothetical protein
MRSSGSALRADQAETKTLISGHTGVSRKEDIMPANSSEEELLKQARFVFKGTVQKLKAANVAGVDKKDKGRTIIVRVDEVVQAPESLGDYTGQDVTVILGEGQQLKAGQKAVFYTNATIFEDNIGVEAVGVREIEGPALALGAAFRDPAINLASQQMKERLETADVVVTGEVTSIRLPEDEPPPARTRGARSLTEDAAAPPRRPISEHEPHWREAVVAVANVEKGAHNKKEVVIRFPESNDVRWYKAPKFRPGQQGVFILHKTQPTRSARTRGIAGTLTDSEAETTDAYTALHPADFQPLQQHPEVQTLIRGIATPAKGNAGSDNS